MNVSINVKPAFHPKQRAQHKALAYFMTQLMQPMQENYYYYYYWSKDYSDTMTQKRCRGTLQSSKCDADAPKYGVRTFTLLDF